MEAEPMRTRHDKEDRFERIVLTIAILGFVFALGYIAGVIVGV